MEEDYRFIAQKIPFVEHVSRERPHVGAKSHVRFYGKVKRCFDVVFAVLLGILCMIPMGIIAILIKLDSPGPIIFAQERLGKDGQPFMLYKFRSMRVDAEKFGPQWANKEDRRCTTVGRILRKLHLDELPQLWNILVGEMSFVGPRPERACFYAEFVKYIPEFQNRLIVLPGLTGWAQVNGGYDLKPEEKIIYDEEYIYRQSFSFDCWCLLKTCFILLSQKGAR